MKQQDDRKTASEYLQRLFRSLRTTKLCRIFAKVKDFAAQTRCAQTYAAKSLTQIFYRASSLKLLQMPLQILRCCFPVCFWLFLKGFLPKIQVNQRQHRKNRMSAAKDICRSPKFLILRSIPVEYLQIHV